MARTDTQMSARSSNSVTSLIPQYDGESGGRGKCRFSLEEGDSLVSDADGDCSMPLIDTNGVTSFDLSTLRPYRMAR
jgi:hypothetical protein